MEWVLSHMEDANFNDPIAEPSQTAPQASTTGAAEAPPTAADPESVMMLVSMGFTDQQAAAALKVKLHAVMLGCHSLALTTQCLQAWSSLAAQCM